MKSFGLLWLPNSGGQMQDGERVVVQKEIWWWQGKVQKGSPTLLKMQTSGAIRDRTRNPMDLRSAALVYAGMLGCWEAP